MRHSRPEFLYFWFYFIIVNGIWIVVPLACILYACKHINAAVARWVGLAWVDRAWQQPSPWA
jgi:hypothetical protein